MNRICWWFVKVLSGTLEPDERDAVCGDLAESSANGGEALLDVMGLVVLRQAELWRDWHPWLALAGLVGVAGVLLSEIAFQFDGEIFLQVRTYWRHGVHFGTGLSVGEDALYFGCLFLALVSWSWAGGFLLGSLSGRATWLTGTLFCLVVQCSFLLRSFFGNASFRGATFPGMIRLALSMSVPMLPFLLGAIWGMKRGYRMRGLQFRQALLLAAAVAILTALLTWTSGWYETVRQVWSEGAWLPIPWPRRLLPLATVSWPAAYLLARASWYEYIGERK
jgi:hypothetical protein